MRKKKKCNRFCVLAFPMQIHSPLWLHVHAFGRFFYTGRKTTHFFSVALYFIFPLLLFALLFRCELGSCKAMPANGMCERGIDAQISLSQLKCTQITTKCTVCVCVSRSTTPHGKQEWQERSRYCYIKRWVETSALFRWYLLHATTSSAQRQCLPAVRTARTENHTQHRHERATGS